VSPWRKHDFGYILATPVATTLLSIIAGEWNRILNFQLFFVVDYQVFATWHTINVLYFSQALPAGGESEIMEGL
jgi:hypothetical protein